MHKTKTAEQDLLDGDGANPPSTAGTMDALPVTRSLDLSL